MDKKLNLLLVMTLGIVLSTFGQSQEIKVEGNVGTFPEIVDGDINPQGTDNTLFAAQYIGATQSKSYRIRNLGNHNLDIYSVQIIGVNSSDFTIITPPQSVIDPNTFSLLEVQFSPLVAGVRNATVSIVNNDSNESPYTFAIRGTGRCIASSPAIHPSSGPEGTVVTINGSNFGPTTSATINGLTMEITALSASAIQVLIPKGAATGTIRIDDGIGCTSNTPFTVIDSRIGGCDGSATLSDLFISEVTDATLGGVSYIEIYNGTGSTINLGAYALGIYHNGGALPTSTLTLSSYNLAHNTTYIIAVGITNIPSQTNICQQAGGNGQLAQQTSTIVGINKVDNQHDMIRLLKANNTVVVDAFGRYMDRTWMDATIVTGDRGFNFRRLRTATQLPEPNFNLANWQIIDWVGSGASSCHTNDYSDIGLYDFSGGSPPLITLQPSVPSSNCGLDTTLSVLAVEGLAGGQALNYQWYYNAPTTSSWTEIMPEDPLYSGQQTAQLTITNLENLNGYQFYVQIRENTINCYKASYVVSININKTTWTGSAWYPTLPNAKTMTILNGKYTTNATTPSFTTCSLIVNSGATLTITDDHYVEVIGDVAVRGNTLTDYGEIIVETKGTFVQRGDDQAAGKFSLQHTGISRVKKSTALKHNWYAYTYWGSPVSYEIIERALSLAPPNRRFYFEAANYLDTNGDDVDDNGDDWQIATGRMIPGVGYAATSKTTDAPFPRIDTTEFIGPFNTGTIEVPIVTNSFQFDNDWNLIGNPYASAIDFKLLHSANASVIDGAAYLWSHFSPPLASNPGNQVLNFNTADYAIITTGSGNVAGPNRIIPSEFIASGQGFLVKGLGQGGNLTFKNSMRMADATSNSQFLRHQNTSPSQRLWINLTTDSGLFSQILMAYVAGATDNFDGFTYDAERNISTGKAAGIYTVIPSIHKMYAIQGKSSAGLTMDEEFPLAFYTGLVQPTRYTLSVAQTEGNFFDENNIFVRDEELGKVHNLSSSDYHFTSTPGDFKARFIIHFKSQTLTINDLISNSEQLSIVELENGHVQFSIGEHLTIKSVTIMDVLGRTLHTFNGTSSTEVFELHRVSQAVYLAKIKLSNDRIITKRVLKRI